MNIQHIKLDLAKKLGVEIPTLMLSQQMAEDKVTPQPWVYFWEDTTRSKITMHEDLFKELSANPSMDNLVYKTKVKEATDVTAEYTIFTIVKPANIVGTF